MRAFLGFLMVLAVSGDGLETVEGGNVLLPCPCSDRNPAKDFRWQTHKNNIDIIVYHNNKDNDPRYNGRVKSFVAENNSNCSLLLSNINADDKGTYKCSFHNDQMYLYHEVDLKVSANNPTGTDEITSNSAPAFIKSQPMFRILFSISTALLLGLCLAL